MKTEFKQNGINYSLLSAPRGRRDAPEDVNAQSAASIWANARQKAKLTNGLDREDRPKKVKEAREEGRRQPVVSIKTVNPKEFAEDAGEAA